MLCVWWFDHSDVVLQVGTLNYMPPEAIKDTSSKGGKARSKVRLNITKLISSPAKLKNSNIEQ